MFRSKLVSASRQASRNVRYNSTAAKATGAVSGIVSRVNGFVSKTVYWSKVSAELAKQVYLKEGFAPPTVARFRGVYEELWAQLIATASNPRALLAGAANIQKPQVVKFTVGAIQVFGLFSLGEIVGRRHIYGYPNYH